MENVSTNLTKNHFFEREEEFYSKISDNDQSCCKASFFLFGAVFALPIN